MFENLNDRQREAVQHNEGPLLLIAGAGAGKTKTITCRIAYLINQGVDPQNILAVTFTNKAAQEMNKRVEKMIVNNHQPLSYYQKPLIATFHSVCNRILRKDIDLLSYTSDFLIYDDKDQKKILTTIIKNKHLDLDEFPVNKVLSSISSFKNKGLLPRNVRVVVTNNYDLTLADIYEQYFQECKKNNALDFDDLLLLTLKIFSDYPKIVKKYNHQWQYILVDEYQDTNHLQYSFIKFLTQTHKNICVVGDSDQSIYGFRGADISNILNFTKDFKDAKTIKLEQNYRSTKTILKAANDVIANNTARLPKNMWTEVEGNDKIKLWHLSSDEDEAESVIREILINHNLGIALSEQVILYRTNNQSRVFEDLLNNFRISYQIIGGLKFYARKEVKDILAYLRIIHNPNDDLSLERIINVPARKIGKTTLNRIKNFSNQRGMSVLETLRHLEMIDNLTPASKKSLLKFLSLYDDLLKQSKINTLPDLINLVIKLSGYEAMLKKDDSVTSLSRLENIFELQKVGERFNQNNALMDFLTQVSLVQDQDSVDQKQESVKLMTIHTAKGLEFDCVYIVGLEENIFPHSRSIDSDFEIEEERRLMYTAMTRARQKLYLTYAYQRFMFGKTDYNLPSRFLSEISSSLIIDNLNTQSANKDIDLEPAYVYDEDSQ